MKPGVLIVLAAAITVVVSAQEQRPVFRGGTTLVPITVTVTDQQGRPVTGLTQADFRIFEDGRPREVTAFFPQMLAPAPANIRGRPRLRPDPGANEGDRRGH